MAIDPRKAAKALRQVMSVANATTDTALSSIEGDAASVQRVAEILVKMEYATVQNGNIRLTESGQAQK